MLRPTGMRPHSQWCPSANELDMFPAAELGRCHRHARLALKRIVFHLRRATAFVGRVYSSSLVINF